MATLLHRNYTISILLYWFFSYSRSDLASPVSEGAEARPMADTGTASRDTLGSEPAFYSTASEDGSGESIRFYCLDSAWPVLTK